MRIEHPLLSQLFTLNSQLKNHMKSTSPLITAIDALQPETGPVIVRVTADNGMRGYGASFATGPGMREAIAALHNGRLPHLNPVGKPALAIEVHHHNMLHAYPQGGRPPHVHAGIDIALWDLAGKILGQPVATLLGGPFRDEIPLYSHCGGKDLLSRDEWRELAAELRDDPHGFKAYKIDFDRVLGVRMQERISSLGPREIDKLERAYGLAREALGDGIDIIVHCHCELDLPSAIRFAKVIERIRPLWFEDPLQPAFSEAWVALHNETSVPLLTGENLQTPEQFEPFLARHVIDCIQPDLINCGGITAGRKIAALAETHRTPMTCHNVSGAILNAASQQLLASVFNAPMLECVRRPEDYRGLLGTPIVIRDGKMRISTAPGLGFEIDEDYLKAHRAAGEPYWS
jgi:L-alanine-DL-glutamate epimerase-like enolase superfamily enzyme